MVFLLGFLACESVSAQESGVLADTRPATNFQLKGVLISNSNRTALVNGQLFQEGDQVGGAEILAIDQGGVRVLMGAREFIVDVGGTFVGGPSSAGATRISQNQHAVEPGETLSGIARRYKSHDVTMNQMMIAMFQANPQAFSNNINVLHQGAILRIPDENELRRQAPEMAAAEVLRHTDRWQAANHERTKIADVLSNKQYGPVESGETLSDIAANLLHDGTTINEMMIALFQANPQAFSNNINVLHQGVILRIPDENELRQQTPETATAEVGRQTEAWRTGSEQLAQLALTPTILMASSDELID